MQVISIRAEQYSGKPGPDDKQRKLDDMHPVLDDEAARDQKKERPVSMSAWQR